jgi:hypothetical protein
VLGLGVNQQLLFLVELTGVALKNTGLLLHV